MPYKSSTYIWHYKLHPIFDMNMPEGYLFEIFKKYLTKEYGYIDDFLVFSHICSNIQSRLSYKSFVNQKEFLSLDIDEVLQNDSQDTFTKIVITFLDKNAISGIQPKSLALLKDKESLSIKEYIIKTWGEEYPQLALNEYFCLKAIEKNENDANNIYGNCIEVLKDSIEELENYITTNKVFEEIGQKMIDSWKLSLSQKTQKEIPLETIRNWTTN